MDNRPRTWISPLLKDFFQSAIPQFGGFDVGTAANFGFAILSDIEAFFVIQAAHGDNRTNVLEAPKVTLFNGQQASVMDVQQRPFVTGLIPIVGDFARSPPTGGNRTQRGERRSACRRSFPRTVALSD